MAPEDDLAYLKDLADAEAAAATPEALAEHERHVRWCIRRSFYNWARAEPCRFCGELIGHWGGGQRPEGDARQVARCDLIPDDVWLDELRPNCFDVRRHRIGDAIRAATCKGKA